MVYTQLWCSWVYAQNYKCITPVRTSESSGFNMVQAISFLLIVVAALHSSDALLAHGIRSIEDGVRSLGMTSAADKIEKYRTTLLGTVTSLTDYAKGRFGYSFKGSNTGWPFESVTFDHPIQSPVDLITSKAVLKDLPVLDIIEQHLNGVKAKVYNSGHTVYVYVKEDPSLRPYLTGGPLGQKFYLEQMHFHWGNEDIWGSEHFVDGESFAVEIHLVHFNSKYKTFEEAAQKPDGLAVLTIFAEASDEDNALLDPLYKVLPLISESKKSTMLDALQSMQWPSSALSTNKEYYTYPGSLTTKPFSENVVFILLPKPIKLSHTQLKAFRSLQSEEAGNYITDNKRQLQPLHHRPIVRSTKLQ